METLFVEDKHYPENKVHGANMGPISVLSAPDGPHVGPINLAIRAVLYILHSQYHGCWWPGNAKIQDISSNGLPCYPRHNIIVECPRLPCYAQNNIKVESLEYSKKNLKYDPRSNVRTKIYLQGIHFLKSTHELVQISQNFDGFF